MKSQKGKGGEMARPRIRQDEKTKKWIVEYYDPAKKQHRLKGFPTKKAAEAKADEIAGEVRKGVHAPANLSKTVADGCAAWLARGEREKLEPDTLRSYRNHVELHLIPLTDPTDDPAWPGTLGDLKLSRVTPPVASAIYRALQNRLSHAMARKVTGSLKAILGEAANHGMIAYNPASTVKLRRRDPGGVQSSCRGRLSE